jgi:O-acetyl-ADP-ribose deacetylase (regulator of RNase III)
MLQHTKGNLIDLAEQGEFDVIVHGCNCLNTMGSGIAKEIRERYPEAYEADTVLTLQLQDDTNSQVQKLGCYTTHLVKGEHNFLIVNAYTQVMFSPRDVDHFEYASFEVILKKMLHEYGTFKIGFPRIGQGLAGGNPERINQMLSDFAVAVSEKGGAVTVVDFDGK